MSPENRVLAALRAAGHTPRRAAGGWESTCPAHDDSTPSLSLRAGEDGRALLHCHAGCTPQSVLSALKLRAADLFAEVGKMVDEPPARTFATAAEAVAALEERAGPRTAAWIYRTAKGDPHGMVLRWDMPDGKKSIRPITRVPGGAWAIGGMPEPRPLYGLPEIAALPPGSRVYVCEGEKAVDAARSVGLLATTSPHGSKSASKADWSPLAGHEVVILPDHDEPGEAYAKEVANLARDAGARAVCFVRLAEAWPEMPAGGDMADFVEYNLLGEGGEGENAIRGIVEALAGKGLAHCTPRAITARLLVDSYPTLRPAVVEGLLRRGEVMNVVAAPKVRKSWLVHALAIAASQGAPWMGFPCHQCGSVLIDGELHLETLAHRLRAVGSAMRASPEELDRIAIWPRRGNRSDINQIAEAVDRDGVGGARIIIIDALYRFLPPRAEENSNDAITAVYNALDYIAATADAAVVVVHHASKGDQSAKSVTDVGSGAGSQSRAADTHLVLRAHEEEGAVVVDAVVRSFQPVDPFCMRFNFPRWEQADDLDPADLYRPGKRKARGEAPDAAAPIETAKTIEWSPEAFASEIVGSTPMVRDAIFSAAQDRGMSRRQAEGLLRRAIADGHLHKHRGSRYSTIPEAGIPGMGG